MRVGLTLDFRNPPRWRRPWRDLWEDGLWLLCQGEALGFDSLHAQEHFFQPDGYFSIDFIAQSVVIARRVRDAGTGERRIDLQTLEIDRGDALLSQLRAFRSAIETRQVPAGAGEEALAALRTALRVVAAMPPLALPDEDA